MHPNQWAPRYLVEHHYFALDITISLGRRNGYAHQLNGVCAQMSRYDPASGRLIAVTPYECTSNIVNDQADVSKTHSRFKKTQSSL